MTNYIYSYRIYLNTRKHLLFKLLTVNINATLLSLVSQILGLCNSIENTY